jgi:hypothetical protein
VYSLEFPVPDRKTEEGAVLERADLGSRLLARKACRSGKCRADRPRVRDAEYAVARVSPAEVEERRKHARIQLGVALAVRPTRVPRLVHLVRVSRPHLVDGQPLPVAHVDLAQCLELLHLELELPGDDPRRLCRAAKRARVDGVETLEAQDVRELEGLASSGLVQRRVGVTLVPVLAVPVGLAVADEDERRRHAG